MQRHLRVYWQSLQLQMMISLERILQGVSGTLNILSTNILVITLHMLLAHFTGIFFEYWQQNTGRGIRRVIACPRGYGKSVIVTLLKVLHDIVFGRENYIVLVSNTQVQAIGKSRDVRTEFSQIDAYSETLALSLPRKACTKLF